MRTRKSVVIAVVAGLFTAGSALSNPSTAAADTATQEAAEVAAAVSETTGGAEADIFATAPGEAIVAIDDTGTVVDIPTDPAAGIEVTTPDGETIGIDLPGANNADDATVVNGTAIYTDALPATSLAVQPTEGGGVQALVIIDNASAPTEFAFPLDLPAGTTLTQLDDGSILATAPDGTLVGTVDTPWATDANGTPVPTSFQINGNTLTQTVSHQTGNYAYPIVADPCWSCAWKIAKCVAAITWVVGSTIFVAAKITKIKSGIKALGGIKETAKLLVGATSKSEKATAIGGAMMGAASEFLGIDTIVNNC